MNALQSFELGSLAREEKLYFMAFSWLEVAWDQLQNEAKQKKHSLTLIDVESALATVIQEVSRKFRVKY